MLELDLSASQRQQTSLRAAQQQSLRVLQMSNVELRDEAERLAAENPFLETEFDDTPPRGEVENVSLESPTQPIDHLYERWPETSEVDEEPWETIAAEETLGEHLRAQMGLLRLDDDVREALLYLIDALDAHGLLPVPLSKLAESNEELPRSAWERALCVLRSFEPTGVGAFDRNEMLALQVEELLRQGEITPETANAYQELTRQGLTGLTSLAEGNASLPHDVLADLQKLLSKLRPNITATFADAPILYVRPEVLVEVTSEDLRITLLRGAIPLFSLTQSGEEVARGDARLRELWQEAKQFVRAVEARNETLLRVARFAALKQRAFFTSGPESLVPLTQQEAAQELGLSDSTISRTVTGKFFRCDFGTFELQTLFPGKNTALSERDTVMARIHEWITAEDPAHPLSDTKITARLHELGIDLARRTVCKYREAAGIPSPAQRKRR